MILLKGVLGGVAAVFLAWVAIVFVYMWRLRAASGTTGLMSVAGGWNYLAQLPSVVLTLSATFGIGFYFTVRLVVRANLQQ